MNTPPCTEGVAWTVYSKALPVRAAHIQLLKDFYGDNKYFAFEIRGNNRRTQPIGDRSIYFNTPPGGSFSGATAFTSSLAALGVAAASLAF